MTTVSRPLLSSVQLTTGSPVSNTSTPQILALQTPANLPNSSGFITITNGLNIPPRMVDRLSNFPDSVYSLNDTDNLVKFIKVLIGAAGAGQWRNRALQARLQGLIQGANFYQLDGFYGALFGLGRLASEVYSFDPYSELATYDQWSEAYSQDASYRTRIMQFGQAVSLGPSAIGMKLVAQAVLQCECDIIESWVEADHPAQTYGGLEALGTYGALEAFSYGQLEIGPATITANRKIFTVVPYDPISLEQAFSLKQVLDVVKAADAVAVIDIGGSQSQTPIALRGVTADSSYWQMVESVVPKPKYADLYNLSSTPDQYGYFQVLRPPFSEYQGEEIVFNPDVIGVVGYEMDQDDNITSVTCTGVVTFLDGTISYYPPNQAMAPQFLNMSARMVSDGLLQAAPYSSDVNNVSATESVSATGAVIPTPQAIGGVALPQTLYVDGMAISAFSTAMQDNNLAGQLGVTRTENDYWASPSRAIDDPTAEVVEVRMNTPHLVNNVTYSIAHLPQVLEIQIYDLTNSTWETVYTQKITDSAPAIIPLQLPSSHLDPLHTSPGCWDAMNIQIAATTTDRIRFVTSRLATGSGPVVQSLSFNTVNSKIVATAMPYSLALKNVTLGYNIYQQSDLPTSPIFTSDALGSHIEWSVRQELPQNAVNGSGIPWRSCPQPTSDSVVNFYMDTRTAEGGSQLIDKIFLDPLYLGMHCTAYYSNDVTDFMTFEAESTPLEPPQAQNVGSLVPTTAGLMWPQTDVASVEIDNTAIQWNPNGPWWWGAAFSPGYYSNAANGETLWDTGMGLNLTVQPGPAGGSLAEITIETADGQTASAPVEFAPGDNVSVVVIYVPLGTNEFTLSPGMYVIASTNSPETEEIINHFNLGLITRPFHPIFDTFSASQNLFGYYQPTEVVRGDVTELTIGAATVNPIPSNMTLEAMVLKQVVPDSNDINNFGNDWAHYVLISPFADSDPSGNTTNSILRFSPTFLSTTNASGFVGGPGYFWPKLNWTPILRDYVVQKGYMNFQPTKASFWKLEFTNLSAQTVNSFVPITQTYNTHQGLSSNVAQEPVIPAVGNPGNGPAGSAFTISSSLSQTNSFSDSTAFFNVFLSPPNPNVAPPTATQVAVAQSTHQALASQGWWWQYQEWHQGQSAPRFVGSGVHNYSSSTITNSGQVGYFAGLNAVSVSRLNFQAGNDVTMFDITFDDDTFMVEPIEWDLNPGDMFTNTLSTLPATATGSTIITSSPVVGLQFATSQSDAIQLANDDTFQSPALMSTDWTDTSQVHVVGDATPSYLPDVQQVAIYRNFNAGTEQVTPQQQGRLVRPDVHPIFDEENLTIPVPSDAAFGGLATSYCGGFIEGFIWAAVRVTGVNVTAPLELQIVDTGPGPGFDTPTVVASVTFDVVNGQTVEQTLGYELGSVLAAGNPMYAQIVQHGDANQNQFNVDRLSLFDEGILWQFSNDGENFYNAFDIRNNAFGVFSFPSPGNQIIWRAVATRPGAHLSYLRIRPIYQETPFRLNNPVGFPSGPNLQYQDQEPPIEDDPLFNGWTNPVPYWWFTQNLDYALLTPSGVPTTNFFNSFFIREATDTLPTVSDSATGAKIFVRGVTELIPTTDSITRHDTDTRNTAESNTTSDTAIAIKVYIPGAPEIVEPQVFPHEGEQDN